MTTKRRVFLDGNGSSSINVEGLGVYVPAIEHYHIKQKLGTEIQQLNDQVNAMQVDLGIAVKTAESLKAVTTECGQLAAQIEALKQGVYHFNLSHGDLNPLLKAVKESSPKQCLADICAMAVMEFAEIPRGAYLGGFVTAELTVYDVYQSARNHVKANYGYDTQPCDDDAATVLRTKLQPMSTATKSDMIMLDAGFGFLTAGHWNEAEQCWVYAAINCNDDEGHDMYFENEYEKNPVGWRPIPRIDKSGE